MLDYDPLHKARDRVSFMNNKVGDGDAREDRYVNHYFFTFEDPSRFQFLAIFNWIKCKAQENNFLFTES